MTAKTRIQKQLTALTKNTYFNSIPLDEIFDIIESEGGIVVDEAGDPWEGFLCGENSQATWKVINIQNTKCWLTMTWYKMPSGRWEIVAYVS